MTYKVDRKLLVELWHSSMSASEISRDFSVSVSVVNHWFARLRTTGHVPNMMRNRHHHVNNVGNTTKVGSPITTLEPITRQQTAADGEDGRPEIAVTDPLLERLIAVHGKQ